MTLGIEPDQSFGRMQIFNALIWALTILGAAVAVKVSDAFTYLLLVLLVGSLWCWAAIFRAR